MKVTKWSAHIFALILALNMVITLMRFTILRFAKTFLAFRLLYMNPWALFDPRSTL